MASKVHDGTGAGGIPEEMETTHFLALKPGTALENLTILKVLGHGGFGITYLARDREEGLVAVKEYLPNEFAIRAGDQSVQAKSSRDDVTFAEGRQAYLDEAQILADFKHPNITRVLQYFEANGTAYIVLQYEEGETLGRRLEEFNPTSEHLRHMMFGILDGLQTVHDRAILHRDIKPSNIIIRDDGTPVLIDFGAARDFAARHSRSVTAIASQGYSPPEQYGVGGQQGPWTDFYALGAVLYRCIAGRAPLDSLKRIRRDPLVSAKLIGLENGYDSGLLAVIDWMLAVNEASRPQTAQEIREALERGAPAASGAHIERPILVEDPGLGFLLRYSAQRGGHVIGAAFKATPPGQYLKTASVGKNPATFDDAPTFFNLDVVLDYDNAGGTTYRVPDAVSRSMPLSSMVQVEVAGEAVVEHVWAPLYSPPGLGQEGRRERRARTKSLAVVGAGLLVALLVGAIGLSLLPANDQQRDRAAQNTQTAAAPTEPASGNEAGEPPARNQAETRTSEAEVRNSLVQESPPPDLTAGDPNIDTEVQYQPEPRERLSHRPAAAPGRGAPPSLRPARRHNNDPRRTATVPAAPNWCRVPHTGLTDVQRIICSNSALRRYDNRLNSVYQNRLSESSPGDKQKLVAAERSWTVARDHVCRSQEFAVNCLRTAYKLRIKELDR